jgi:dihydrofolate reductase
MSKLSVFNQVSLDGYFTDKNGDISWAKQSDKDDEWQAFVAQNATDGGVLLFGRVTYEMMAGYWTLPVAMQNDRTVAEQMNKLSKVVFSRKLDRVSWGNTTLVKGDMVAAVRKMKREPGKDLVILGSGSIVSQLSQEGLIDAYQFVVNPVVLGAGRTMFEGLKKTLSLELTNTRSFKNGNVVMSYSLMT